MLAGLTKKWSSKKNSILIEIFAMGTNTQKPPIIHVSVYFGL